MIEQYKVFKPFSLANDRGRAQKCEICEKRFNIMVKIQHKCKRCYRSICVDCGKNKALIYKQDGTSKIHRICMICQNEYHLIDQYKQKYKLEFAKDSQFCNLWAKKINKQKKTYSQIMTEYSQCLAATNESITKFKRQSKNIFKELFQSYNYSFRNFICVVLKASETVFEEKVQNVTIALLGRVPGLIYFPEIVYLVVFFLCFCSECHAYLILVGLVEKIYPIFQNIKKLKRDNLISKQLKIMVKMIEILAQTTNKDEIIMLKQYLQTRVTKFLISLTINLSNFEVSLHIIHQMIIKLNYLEFYKGITSIIYMGRNEIAKRKTYDEIQLYVLKNVSLQSVKTLMLKFQKVELNYQINHDVYQSPEFQKVTNQNKSLEKYCSNLEELINRKDQEIKELNQSLKEKVQTIKNNINKIEKLEQEVFFVGEKRNQLAQFDKLKKDLMLKHNQLTDLEIKYQILNKEAQQTKKKLFIIEEKMNWFDKLNNDNEIQICNLRSQNEILKVKIEAKNIDFNTKRIQEQMLQKNKKIMKLQKENVDVVIENKFYKEMVQRYKKDLEERKKPKTVVEEKQVKSEADSQYQKQIELSSVIINRQIKNIEDLKIKIQQLQDLVNFHKNENQDKISRIQNLQEKLGQMAKFQSNTSQFLGDKLEEFSLLEQHIVEEENILKKNNLQRIRNKFEQCFNELKIRALQLRLKMNKLQMTKKQLKNQPEIKQQVIEQQNERLKNQQQCIVF